MAGKYNIVSLTVIKELNLQGPCHGNLQGDLVHRFILAKFEFLTKSLIC